jgi:hypothetical protein
MAPSPIFGLSGIVLVVASIVLFGAAAWITHVVADRRFDEDHRRRSRDIVGPLTPALAALFSVMVAFTIVTEAGYLRTAQTVVTVEGTAASRLAWASTTPGVDGAPIRRALTDALDTMVRTDWSGRDETDRTPPAIVRSLRRLESVTRGAAVEPGTPSAVSGELLSTLDSFTSARRDVVAEATRSIPLGYLAVLVITGLALVVNVALLSLAAGRRGLALVIGVVVIVGLSIALLIGVAAPFMGPLQVNHGVLDRVLADLHGGMFRLSG